MEKRSTMKHKEVGNIEEMVFVIFVVFLKQSEKQRMKIEEYGETRRNGKHRRNDFCDF